MPPVPAYPGQPLFGAWSGGPMSPDKAMRLTGVWACVRLISESVAMMPLEAFGPGVDGGPPRPLKNPGPLLKSPAAGMTAAEFVQVIVTSMLLRGNFYGMIVARDGYGLPTQIEPLNPDRVAVRVDDEGTVRYRVGKTEIDDPHDILHIRGMRLPGAVVGMSPIEYAARALHTTEAAGRFGANFFDADAHPTAILATKDPVSPESAKVVKERFKAAVQNRDIAVLGLGLEYSQVQVSPEESQFLETQKWGLAEIARVYGVPPEMIGGTAGGGLTYSNVTQRSLDFLTYALQPWLTRLESALTPLIPGARFVRFNTSALVRMTATDRWAVNRIQLETKAATINEVRAEEGRGPVEWGDTPVESSAPTPAAATEGDK